MIVIKFGGHAMRDENGDFSSAIATAIRNGISLVIVHGGGPQIDKSLKEKGISSKFVGGFRVTTPEIFDVVEEVLVHQIAPSIVSSLAGVGVKAVALTATSSRLLEGKALDTLVDGSRADLGRVGVVTSVDSDPIEKTIRRGELPVISPIARDQKDGIGLNVNADLAAAAIAGAVDAMTLIIMTDVAGIFRSWPDTSSLIDEISVNELSGIKTQFEKGMAPKVQACLDAIDAGARTVRIIDGTKPEALSLALQGIGGTLVTK